MYVRARQAWSSLTYPDYIRYVISVHVAGHGNSVDAHYSGSYAAATRRIWVNPFSQEETDHPYIPRGTRFGITAPGSGTTTVVPVGPEPSKDPVGIPVLTPTYSFGMNQGSVAAPVNPAPPPVLRVIGNVVVQRKEYSISCIAREPYKDTDAYHLELVPIRDPLRYRLRELWVDERSFRTLKMISAGNFTDGPGVRIPWTITFQNIGGAQYIDTETANAALRYSRHRQYSTVVIRFSNIEPSTGLGELNVDLWHPVQHDVTVEP